MKKPSDSESIRELKDMPLQMSPANPVKNELADVFAQIGQVNSVVRKIEGQKKEEAK